MAKQKKDDRNEIIIIVEGGLVQTVFATDPKLQVHRFDFDGDDPKAIKEMESEQKRLLRSGRFTEVF